MLMTTKDRNLAKIIGKAFFYASIQASIGSVEMSSKFSVMNFAKDQATLQRAADALRGYIFIGTIWAIASMLVLYGSDGWLGAWIGLAANAILMGWIIITYINAFKSAAQTYNLQVPCVFGPSTISG